ncbi:MAG TPA: cytochrome c3 family protein [Gemmatimonadales bacterium]|nr:cytochrome c3 family protein [Gemmatimonadales bacterium]
MRRSFGLIRQSLFALVLVAGCTKTDIVYRDREPFNPAPDAASGMLGYYTVATKQTTCGNCHVGQQAKWIDTKHAGAYATLAALPAAVAAPACYSCHTTSTNGNGLPTPKRGWDAVKDSAYHDVQCESCHGPGTTHVTAPSRTNFPLARVGMPSTGIPATSAASSNASCAACHSGAHTPFAEEWSLSGHGSVVAESGTPVANNASCAPCHNGKQTLASWGVNTNYIERDSAGVFPVTCTVCHDPHAKNNPKQLRFSITAIEPTANLCMKCHDRRAVLTTGTTRLTPHAPQGDVLLGTAGYRSPGVIIEGIAIATTHASSANSKLCAGCHIQRYTFTDATSGNFVFQSTGHRFLPIPCVDANGPTVDQSCAYTTAARSFKGCVNSGCHNSEAIASSAFNSRRATIAVLADQIWTDLNHNEALDAAPVDGGYLAKVKQQLPTEFPATAAQATKITPAMGAFFNVATFAERYSNGDRSKGVHNPFLGTALLAGNINELLAAYAFLPAPPMMVQAAVESSLAEAKIRQPSLFRERTELKR